MKRRLFVLRSLGGIAVAASAGAPALAFAGRASARIASVDVRRHEHGDALAGGCSNHRRRSASAGYTLAYALGKTRSS